MAKPAVKGKGKTSPQTSTTTSKLKSGPPSPYSPPPSSLRPFLDNLNPKHIYITHIDKHATNWKLRVFTIPVFMNTVIIMLLAWRARNILPYYSDVLMAMWGYDNERKIGVDRGGQKPTDEIITRTFVFMLDFFLVTLVAPWPRDFFIGSASPFSFRMKLGFHDKEIVVRRSRKWDTQLPKDWLEQESSGEVYRERIMPSISREWVDRKTSFLMQDKSWDLDYAAMMKAHGFVQDGKYKLEDFEKTVIVHTEEFGWLIWQVWKLDEVAQDDGRKKIVLFKDKLTVMGKESLFFRWIELIQYESSGEDGFTKQKQEHAVVQARELFESQGVDFDKFWDEIGGKEGFPGLDVPA